jgi:catechol 2,3-dioxygenase-like lactoylglutathione lyase family enzyme
MRIAALDHLVLTVADLGATVAFYERLGMRAEEFAGGRLALRFGEQKINLHEAGSEFQPHALHPEPGSADLCFLVEGSLDAVAHALAEAGVPVELGPVEREGAAGEMDSLYVRDPDGNLVELSRPR